MPIHFLFIYTDFLEVTKNSRGLPGSYSEGIASLSAMLKEGGHKTSLYHQTYMPDENEFTSTVKSFAPDMIGFSLRTTVMNSASVLIGWLDKHFPEIPVVTGGYHPTLAPEEVIALTGVDAVCIGEGEFALRELADRYAETGAIDTGIKSMWFRQPDGSVIKNPVRPYLLNLDELPFPDLDLFDYRNLSSNRLGIGEVIVSRGCLYSCTYCSNAQMRNAYEDKKHYARFRSPENAIQMLERAVQKDPSLKCLNFNDAILNMFPEWFYKFMELYKERVHLKFTCNLRFNLMDEEMCRVLAECGCYLVTIGLENGNDEYRRKYLQRSMQNDHIIKVAGWLKQYGVTVYTYNIVGLPHETLALTLETIKLNARIKVDNEVVSFFYPYPGTKIREIAEEGGFINDKVNMNERVQLKMPNYPRSDIIYARYSFHKLIKAYRKIFEIPDAEKAAKKEAALDKRILHPLYPRGLIGSTRSFKHHSLVNARRFASKFAPSMYRKLRNIKHGVK